MPLRRPEHIHNVQTPDDYKAFQAAMLQLQNGKRPQDRALAPWTCLAPRAVYVAFGKWLLRCVCGNAPSVDPEWRLACCLECGAVFEQVAVPADYQAIEAVLLLRPAMRNQNWLPTETLDDLRAENAAHGVQ